MALTFDDDGTFDRLRDKYSSIMQDAQKMADMQAVYGSGAPSITGDGTRERKLAANVDVNCCPLCKGAGTLIEDYNHRRLEKMCNHCGGNGVLVYKDGKKVEEPSASGNGRAAAVAAVPKPAWAQSVPERIERLQAKMTKLEAKIGEYSHEKAGHEVAMESAAMSKGEREARKEVMTQLDAQIGRLQAMVQKFAKQVYEYRNPSKVEGDAGEGAAAAPAKAGEPAAAAEGAAAAAQPPTSSADDLD